MKITEYPSASFFDTGDVLIKDGTNGTKKIASSDLVYALFDGIPEMHNQIYRGKNLGSTFTSTQHEAISSGSFHDLWLGDYWEISGNKYRIFDFDYYRKYKGSLGTTSHHVVIIPDDAIENSQVPYKDNGLIDRVGYNRSTIRTNTLVNLASTIKSAFGSSYILKYKDDITTGLIDGGSTVATQDCEVELPSVYQIKGNDSTLVREGAYTFSQFSLIRINPISICSSSGEESSKTYWLRDVGKKNVSSQHSVLIMGINGNVGCNKAGGGAYVRPFFLLS